MSDMLQVTDKNFHEALKAPSAAIEFWADWCPGCKAVAPVMGKLAQELKGQVLVVGANIDHAPKAAEKYEIASIPTLILFRDGQEIHRIDGTTPYRKLLAELQSRFDL